MTVSYITGNWHRFNTVPSGIDFTQISPFFTHMLPPTSWFSNHFPISYTNVLHILTPAQRVLWPTTSSLIQFTQIAPTGWPLGYLDLAWFCYPFLHDFFLILTQGHFFFHCFQRTRKREREKHQLVASRRHPDQRSNLQPRYVLWSGIEPTTLRSPEWWSNRLTHAS